MKIQVYFLGVFLGLTHAVPLVAQGPPPASGLSPYFHPLRVDSRLVHPAYLDPASPLQQEARPPWDRLAAVGPGHQAVVSLSDGTLRGGKIVEVLPSALRLESSGQVLEIPRADMVTVRVQRKSNTMAGGLIGFVVSGLGWTVYACSDDDCGFAGALAVFTLLGAPGGLIGALIGSQTGGDVEFIF